MFITRFAPVFFDADDGGGSGPPAAQAAPSAAPPMSADPDFAAARAAFLADPPPIEEIPEPSAEVDPLDDPALDELSARAPAPQEGTPEGPGAADPYAEFGGRDEVEKGIGLRQAFKTESGIRLIVAQSLQALGYTPEQIRQALTGAPIPPGVLPEPTPEPDPIVDVDDDDYVSGAQLKAIVAKAVEAAAEQAATRVRGELGPTVDSFQATRQAQAGAIADQAYAEVIGAWPDTPEEQEAWRQEQVQIQAIAARFVADDDWSASGIRMAIIRGAEALRVQREADLARFVAKKRAARDAQPTNTGGSHSPGGETATEPQNLKEAHAIMEAQGYFK